MKTNPSIQLKAGILLVVFALNTIVGFACAVGIDMGFNSHHHDEEATEATVHIHADGKKHIHYNEPSNHSHDKSSHHHDDADSHHQNSKDNKDNCCNEKVMKFVQLDKFVPQPYSAVNPIFFTAFISSFYDIDVVVASQITESNKYFVRSYHPPISDIRIAIQSFQI